MDNSYNIWTEENELACKKAADRAGAFVWLYNETTITYKRRKNIFNLIIAGGGYLLGSSGIPTLFINWSNVKWINFIIQILMIIMGIISTIYVVLAYDKTVEKCTWASSKFSSLFLEIKKEVDKDPKMRIDYATFYEKIYLAESEVRQSGIYIPDKIIEKYYNRMGDYAINFDELFIHHIDREEANMKESKSIIDLSEYSIILID